MGYRLYVHKEKEERAEWCGGKVYGYEGVDYRGAVYLYSIDEEFKEEVDFQWGDVKDLYQRLRDYFECQPYPEIEIKGEQFLTFLKLYREDAKYDFKYFEPIELDAIYILEWW